MNMSYCPECKQVLLPGNDFCQCGWGLSKNKKREKTEKYSDGLCEWEHGGITCPEVGAHSKAARGEINKGPWYCIRHLYCKSNEQGLKIIQDYNENGLSKREPITKIIFDNSRDVTDKKVIREPGEKYADYCQRVVNERRSY